MKRGFKSWCEKVAEHVRKDLDLQPGAPLDPWVLARHSDIRVWAADEIPNLDQKVLRTVLVEDKNSWSAATLNVGSTDLVILNSSHSRARQTSSLMHEIAHLLLGHNPARVDVSEDGFLLLQSYNKEQEEEADWLGGTLLLPRIALVWIRGQDMDLAQAATLYGASRDLLRWRLDKTGVNLQFHRRAQMRRASIN